MTNLSDAATTAERRATTLLVERLRSADRITRADLNAAMVAGFGGSDADGLWTQRDSFEILEHALAHHLQFGPYPLRSLADVGAACDLLDRLPTQTVRSEEQIEWQQFSTPVDLAAVAFVLPHQPPYASRLIMAALLAAFGNSRRAKICNRITSRCGRRKVTVASSISSNGFP